MTVLVLTSEEDVTADMVIRHLAAAGTPVLRLDPADCPGRVDFAARITAGGGVVGHIATELGRVDFADIRSIWVRRPGPPGRYADVQPEWVALETERAFYGALRALDVPWMNPPEAVAGTQYKVAQLVTARRVGMTVPASLFATIPEEAAQFARAAEDLIVKSVSGRHPENPPLTFPTSRVEAGADFSGVSHSATCLQHEVRAVAHLRLTMVGTRLFPCFITPPAGVLDWRFEPTENCQWEIKSIPPELRKSALEFMAAYGLVYGALDFAITEEGEFYFLEVNAKGQFGFVELQTRAPISEAIATWLTEPRSQLSCWG
ncbi:MvdC/MvdD family ATP grasp protein [Streptomyces antarcticus]|uniref:MvdC/MvdD family ATP grasp protein n=1 Tax=Streptomyces antarcticus TaxID=2996458 RepID=UPI002270D385|nr:MULTISPECIES: alpha-L-glutamate ligase [unclassified Streptomyces]MCY0941932.1 alpha-L-glutamate ligase [Streptomyces sp. H34-AA3]MCZ4082796.1 alpha-L-glutamate ligase [Streptomyces sp. H34-S5]